MRSQAGDKHVVNNGSMSAVWIVPGAAVYSMTKAAVDSFSTVMRDELEEYGFGVTLLVPGLVNTAVARDSGSLRLQQEQDYDRTVKPYSDYLEETGKGVDVGAGRGRVHLIGAGKPAGPIEPDCVGPMVMKAIKLKRPYCMTHPAPVDAIMSKAQSLLEGYDPDLWGRHSGFNHSHGSDIHRHQLPSNLHIVQPVFGSEGHRPQIC
jgi:hypothetical protein